MPKVVQKLYNTCKEVFVNNSPGYVPPPEDIERLRLVLDNMKSTNVGLSPDMPYFKIFETEEVPAVTYLHIYDSDKFSIGIFCLPPSAVIPLHNHPNMTVFSKLLFGSMHIKSYDWVSDAPITQPSHPERRLAKVHIDSDFTAPCESSILYPSAGGNMHCFTAITSCAVLDVLGPPYSDLEGRHCTYYNTLPFTSYPGDLGMFPEEELEKYAWLEEKRSLMILWLLEQYTEVHESLDPSKISRFRSYCVHQDLKVTCLFLCSLTGMSCQCGSYSTF